MTVREGAKRGIVLDRSRLHWRWRLARQYAQMPPKPVWSSNVCMVSSKYYEKHCYLKQRLWVQCKMINRNRYDIISKAIARKLSYVNFYIASFSARHIVTCMAWATGTFWHARGSMHCNVNISVLLENFSLFAPVASSVVCDWSSTGAVLPLAIRLPLETAMRTTHVFR